jgi:hypothetical protein
MVKLTRYDAAPLSTHNQSISRAAMEAMAVSPARLARAECTVEALVQVLVAVSAKQPDLVNQAFDSTFNSAFADAAYRTGHAAHIKDMDNVSAEVFLDILGDLS